MPSGEIKKEDPRYKRKEEAVLYNMARVAQRMGMIEKIPSFLDLKIPAMKSRKGKMGAIVVDKTGQIRRNSASSFIRKFTQGLGGKEEAVLALSAIEDRLSNSHKKLLEMLRSTDPYVKQRGLPYAIAACKAEPVAVVRAITEGLLVLGKAEALGELAVNQGALMRDLLRHAMDKTDKCLVCLGLGTVPDKSNAKLDLESETNKPCPNCSGSGFVITSSEHKEWAMKKALEVAELGEKKKGTEINVNTAIGVKVDGSASARVAQLAKVSDEILFQTKSLPPGEDEILEAEVI